MRRHDEHHFGFIIDPGPDDFDSPRPVMIQFMHGAKDAPGTWARFGAAFGAMELDDLMHALHRAKELLDTRYVKEPGGYRPRRGLI